MIRRYRTSHYHHIPCLARLPDQIPRSLRHTSFQHLVPVLCDPHDMILDVKNRVGAPSVLSHLSILQHRGWKRPA